MRVFLVIFSVYLIGLFSHALYLGKTVYGDGVYYYAWLQSIAIDHDIDFTNDYQKLGVRQERTPTGMLRNVYSIGPALLWLPAYVGAHAIFRGVGNELSYQMIIGLVNAFYVFVGLLLLYRLLAHHYSRRISMLAVGAIAFATNLYFYGAIDPVNSHAVSFFASVLFLSLLSHQEKNWAAIGISLALLGLIRPQDLLFGILLIPYLSRRMVPGFAIGFLVAFLPQMYLWHLFYGSWWANPYLAEGLGFHFLSPHLVGVLFSPNNGLFLWTPILLLATIGLLHLAAKDHRRKLWIFLLAAQWYLVASWSVWSQGGSYSGRMFISLLPIFAFGLAELFAWISTRKFLARSLHLVIIAPLSIINILLIVGYLATH